MHFYFGPPMHLLSGVDTQAVVARYGRIQHALAADVNKRHQLTGQNHADQVAFVAERLLGIGLRTIERSLAGCR